MPADDAETEPRPTTGETPPDLEASSSSYGPIRRRVCGKSDDKAMYRPAAMREDDFVEIMREVVPQLIDQAVEQTRTAEGDWSSASKRPLESSDGTEPLPSRPRMSSGVEEVLSVEEMTSCQDEIDVLIAAHVQKKATKELPACGNSPELQPMVNESKMTEWSTILEKGAVKVHLGKRAQTICEKFPHRFIGSRFVITRKPLEEGAHVDEADVNTFKVKSRWCLQGHLDPDLETKAQDRCSSLRRSACPVESC